MQITFKCRGCGTRAEMHTDDGANGGSPPAPASAPIGWVVHTLWSQEEETGLLRTVSFASCSEVCFKKLIDQSLSLGDLWPTTPTAQA